jgi:ABC-type antimicrobial peptide transport system permease subunit
LNERKGGNPMKPEVVINNTELNVKERKSPKLRHWKAFYKKFKRNKLALVGGYIVLFYILLAIFAPLISPQDPMKLIWSTNSSLHQPNIGWVRMIREGIF